MGSLSHESARITFQRGAGIPGSIRVPRVGFGVPPKRTFKIALSRWMTVLIPARDGSPSRRDASTNTRNACAPRIPTRPLQPHRSIRHHIRIFPIRPRRPERRPTQRRRADVAFALCRIAPSAVRILILRQPAQSARDQVPMPLAIHRRERHHRRRGRKRAARQFTRPMSLRSEFREKRLFRFRQSRAQPPPFDLRPSAFVHPYASLSCSRFRAGRIAHASLQPKSRLSSSRFRLIQP